MTSTKSYTSSAHATPTRSRMNTNRARASTAATVLACVAAISLGGCSAAAPDEGATGRESAQGAAEPGLDTLSTAVCMSAVAGLYCCGDSVSGCSSGTLYHCTGKGAVATVSQVCTSACETMPAGHNDQCAPSPIKMNATDLAVFQNGNFDSATRLLWSGAGTHQGGSSFDSSYRASVGLYTRVNAFGDTSGQCPDLVKSLSGRTGATTTWTRGVRVVSNCGSIPIGTAVATFTGSGAMYSTGGSDHSAFVCGCSSTSITLCDENFAIPEDGLVRRHTLPVNGKGNYNDAGAYYVILAP
ncbi:MAG: BPSL0067 family protein [Polyangiales bacterium]